MVNHMWALGIVIVSCVLFRQFNFNPHLGKSLNADFSGASDKYYIFFTAQSAGTRETAVSVFGAEYVRFGTACYVVAVIFENIACDLAFLRIV
jgi:hypothetical protein